MNYIIEYEEVVKRINSITIEVEDKEAGEEIADELDEIASDFNCPDDIFDALRDMSAKIVKTYKGTKSCQYEIQ